MIAKPSDSKIFPEELRSAAAEGDRSRVASLLLLNAPAPAFSAAAAIHAAAAQGHADCVKLLIPLAVSASSQKALALLAAARNGHFECLRILIDSGWAAGPPSSPGYDSLISAGLCLAARNGHAECVHLFMPRASTLRHGKALALFDAVDHGHAAVVEAMAAHDLSLIYMASDRIDPSNVNHRHISQFIRAVEERRLLSKIAGSEDCSSQPTIPAPRL